MGALSKYISLSNIRSEKMINSWNQSMDLLKRVLGTTTKTITPQQAEKYKFDLDGLFYNEFQIPKELIYPNMKLNGYDASYCYDGKKLSFLIFDGQGLNDYYTAFKRSDK